MKLVDADTLNSLAGDAHEAVAKFKETERGNEALASEAAESSWFDAVADAALKAEFEAVYLSFFEKTDSEYINKKALMRILNFIILKISSPDGWPYNLTNKEVAPELLNIVKGVIKDMPLSDVAPVVHGHWEFVKEFGWDNMYKCSVCGRKLNADKSYTDVAEHYPYCHCGAKMGKETENE